MRATLSRFQRIKAGTQECADPDCRVDCLTAGIASLNPVDGMDVRLLCWLCCVVSGLCDGLITRSEEPYRVCVCVCVCVCLSV
jgi:hypothetical protein